VSNDGRTWSAALVLESEAGEYSYVVDVAYTWKRQRIKHVAIDPAALEAVPMPDAKWPKDH
jgi:predicted neuraminidase